MIDSVKSYVQLAAGLGETSTAKAREAASDLVALSGIEGKVKKKKVEKKIAAVAEDLLEAAESNRKQVVKLVRREVEEAIAKLETRTGAELSQAQETIERMQKQLDELRGLVASGVAAATGRASEGAARVAQQAQEGGQAAADEALRLMADAGQSAGSRETPPAQPQAAKRAPAKKAPAKKAPAKKAPAKKTPAKKAPAKKTSTTTKSTAAKSTAKTSTAKKSTAAKSTAKKTPAKKTTTKKSTTKKTPAKKA